MAFNRSVVMRYRSFLESLSLSATTIDLHLSTIRRLADESTESGWLSPEMAIGIRRVRGVKLLGWRIGNWLTSDQAQRLVNSVPHDTLRGILPCPLQSSVRQDYNLGRDYLARYVPGFDLDNRRWFSVLRQQRGQGG